MARFGSGVAVVALAVGAALAPSAVAAPSSPFAGSWVSMDTDGSNQTLRISGSGQGMLGLSYVDDRAGLCGGAPARFGGVGQAVDDELMARVMVVCTPGGATLRQFEFSARYLPGTDELEDMFGVVWHRA